MSEARQSRSDDKYNNWDVLCLGRLLGREVMDVPLRATRSCVSLTLCEPPSRNPFLHTFSCKVIGGGLGMRNVRLIWMNKLKSNNTCLNRIDWNMLDRSFDRQCSLLRLRANSPWAIIGGIIVTVLKVSIFYQVFFVFIKMLPPSLLCLLFNSFAR